MPKSKWFKAATAGPTADGRTIKEEWLSDIAESYDRNEYEANVYIDHFRWYGNFGTVMGVKLGKDDQDRACLFMQIDATPNLLQLHQNRQYKHPSLGVNPNFKNTGKAYLDHLAAVTQPASVGTQPMQFSHENGDDVELMCFACDEAIELQLEPSQAEDAAPSWFTRFMTKHFSQEDEDMSKEVLEQLQTTVTQLQEDFAALKDQSDGATPPAKPADTNTDFATQLAELKQAFEEFKNGQSANDDQATKFTKMESQITELATKLAAALEEQDGTETPAHTGG